MIRGSCLCGGVRFEVDRVAGPFELCHCPRCRKASGSAFVAGLGVRARDFRLLSGAELIRTYEAPIRERPPAYRVAFCSRCGSPVPDPPVDATWLEVPAGLLDDDPVLRPDKHIFVECKSPWFPIADSLPRLTKEELARFREGSREPVALFSERSHGYVRFIRSVRYPQGLRAYFLRSPLLRSGLRVLDAGCGTGIVTLALREALSRRGLRPGPLHAFDLTPAMLDRFRRTLREQALEGIDVAQADVLQLDALPAAWGDYDLVVSASMLEYVPRARLTKALAGLRSLLKEGGTFVLFITRRNWLTRPLIGRWWHSNLYAGSELRQALREAGFASIAFRRFPASYRYLDLWGHVVEAHS